MSLFDYFFEKILLFPEASTYFNKWVSLELFLWDKDMGTKRRFIENFLTYLWHAPKRHRYYKIYRKSWNDFPKIVEIKAKSDERQGKTLKIFAKMCVISLLQISWMYCLNSWKFFTLHETMQYIYNIIYRRTC